ncbi:MAG: site-specific integrase [Planctomycetota bacterium]
MASLVRPKNKGASVQWYDRGGSRRTLYLGDVPKRWAEEFRRHVETLVEHAEFGTPLDRKATAWLAELDPKWRNKLAAKGLAEATQVRTLADLVADYRRRGEENEAAASTLEKIDGAGENLFAFFGRDRGIHSITPADASDFARWLPKNGRRDKRDKPLAASSVGRQLRSVSAFFSRAQKRHLINANPFEGLAIGEPDSDAQQYVPWAVVAEVLTHCEPALATSVALARLGGLRHQSETQGLRIEWVNLEAGRMLVESQKNRRYQNKRWREVPIDPLLAPYLRDAIEIAPPGATHVCHQVRGITNAAWRGRLERACKRAAIVPWASLWHSLRGSRATDLIDAGHPEHVVCYWQNTGPRELRKHYLRPTAEHYALAAGLEKPAQRQAEPKLGDHAARGFVAARGA